MKLEIDCEVASALAAEVMMQDYVAMVEDPYYDDYKATKDELIAAYHLVFDYCTTERQRERFGIVL